MGYEKLKVDFDAQRIRFSSLQYVTVKPMERKAIASGEVLTVELDNYVLLSPDALNLEAKDKERLQPLVQVARQRQDRQLAIQRRDVIRREAVSQRV